MAVALAGKASGSGVSRGTKSGVPVLSSRLQPKNVVPSPLVVQRSAPSGGRPGRPGRAGGSSREVFPTAKFGLSMRRMDRPVATGSRCSASTATRSAGLPGSTRGMAGSSSPVSSSVRESTTARQRSRSRSSQGAIRASTLPPVWGRQSSSAVTGRSPYGCRPTRSIGSGPRPRTCSQRWSRTARHGRPGAVLSCLVPRSSVVSAASAKPLPRVGQVSRVSAVTADGSASSAPEQPRRNPGSGRPKAAASASATGRSPASGSGSGPG